MFKGFRGLSVLGLWFKGFGGPKVWSFVLVGLTGFGPPIIVPIKVSG